MKNWKQLVRERLPELRVPAARESEIVAELAQQLEQTYTHALAAGASPAEAESKALAQFPNWRALAREIQSAEPRAELAPERPSSFFSGTLHDLRHAARVLRKNPAFALLAIATLAFGIGANSAIFTVVDTLALRPLPYQDPSRLVAIGSVESRKPADAQWVSLLDFIDIRDHASSFSSIAAISPLWNDVVTTNSAALRLQSLYVSASLFPMLGVSPAAGRFFGPGEDKLGAAAHVVVLSYPFWQSQFGADRSLVGRSIDVNGVPYTVIGIAPRDFHYLGEPVAGTPGDVDLWMPLAANPLTVTPRYVRFLKVVAKTKPGVTVDQSRAEIRTFGEALGKQYPDIDGGLLYSASPLADQISGRVRPAMLLLLGAVGLVLLMACANVANLLLTSAIARGKEIAVRAALGASRFRLLRQFLTESSLLTAIGAVTGVALALAIIRALTAAAPPVLLEGRAISLDARATIFTVAVAIVSALLAGLPPALRIVRGDIAKGLGEGARGYTGGHHRFRAGLAISQISLALALLVGAGLLIRSFVRLLNVNPGFDPDHAVTVSTLLPPSITTPAQALPMDRALIDRIAQIPGVRAAGAVSRLPLLGSNLGSWLWAEGKTYPTGAQPSVEYRVASPGYFAAMQIPLIAGRIFDDHDIAAAPATVALINHAAAQSFWPGENPVGRRIKLGANPEKQNWITVIGVIGDVRHFGLDREAAPEIYRPLGFSSLGNPVLVARVDADPAAILPQMAAAIRAVNPAMPAYNAFAMSAVVARSNAQRRFIMQLLSGFAFAALLLATIGIYGTISQSVAQRTRELGVRIALGASRQDVLRLVLSQAVRLATLGVLIGGTLAAFLTRLMRSSLFEVAPLDPLVFAASAFGLALVATLACLAPALRATRVDPLVALRHQA